MSRKVPRRARGAGSRESALENAVHRAATTGCVGTGETGLLADGLAERIATHVREDGEWMCHGWAHPEEIVLVGCTADDALRAEASE